MFVAKFSQKFDGKWSIPGGKVDFGEDPVEAVIREVREETNLSIEHPEYFTNGSFVVDQCHVIYIDFMANFPSDGAEVRLNSEFEDWAFMPLNRLFSTDLIPEVRDIMKKSFKVRYRQQILEKMRACELGLIRKTISLQPSKPCWKDAFHWVKNCLALNLNQDDQRGFCIEHIGSTCLPDIHAKPILDILIQFDQETSYTDTLYPLLEQLGFTYKGDAVGNLSEGVSDSTRHFYAFYDHDLSVDFIHLHVVRKGHPHGVRMLNFKNYLLENPEACREYRDLKRDLFSGKLSRSEYTLSKNEFVESILRLAMTGSGN